MTQDVWPGRMGYFTPHSHIVDHDCCSTLRAIVLLESNLGFSELEQMVQDTGRDQVGVDQICDPLLPPALRASPPSFPLVDASFPLCCSLHPPCLLIVHQIPVIRSPPRGQSGLCGIWCSPHGGSRPVRTSPTPSSLSRSLTSSSRLSPWPNGVSPGEKAANSGVPWQNGWQMLDS